MLWCEKKSGMLILTYQWEPPVSYVHQEYNISIRTQVAPVDADKVIVDNKCKVTEIQLRTFMELCWVKYVKARIEPGLLVLLFNDS